METLRRTLSLGAADAGDGELDVRFSSTANMPLAVPEEKEETGGGWFDDEEFDLSSDEDNNGIDVLECGGAKETITSRHLNPIDPSRKKLQKCHVVRENRTNFWFYCDSTNEFMLSAKIVGNNIYISQYESFPNTFVREGPPGTERVGSGESFIAVVRLNPKTKAFRLYSRTCEGCDEVLGLHTCGAQSLMNGDRQMLLEVAHLAQPVLCGENSVIDCNVCSVKLPSVYEDLSRDCWCARFGGRGSSGASSKAVARGGGGGGGKYGAIIGSGRSRPLRAALTEPEPRCETAAPPVSRGLKQRSHSAPAMPSHERPPLLAGNPHQGTCHLITRTPRFDRTTGSLRMKFLNNRVKMASSKNLIFCVDKNSDPGAVEEDQVNGVPTDARVVCQIGKYKEDRYNMDYRFPLSPVQAFAMCLTLFKWQAGNDG